MGASGSVPNIADPLNLRSSVPSDSINAPGLGYVDSAINMAPGISLYNQMSGAIEDANALAHINSSNVGETIGSLHPSTFTPLAKLAGGRRGEIRGRINPHLHELAMKRAFEKHNGTSHRKSHNIDSAGFYNHHASGGMFSLHSIQPNLYIDHKKEIPFHIPASPLTDVRSFLPIQNEFPNIGRLGLGPGIKPLSPIFSNGSKNKY